MRGRRWIAPPLHYRVLAKKSGNIRLIEAPRKTQGVTGSYLREVLERFHLTRGAWIREGRSIKTFAAPHVDGGCAAHGFARLLSVDLGAAVQALFRTAGYPDAVATAGGICTNAAPRECGFAGQGLDRWR